MALGYSYIIINVCTLVALENLIYLHYPRSFRYLMSKKANTVKKTK